MKEHEIIHTGEKTVDLLFLTGQDSFIASSSVPSVTNGTYWSDMQNHERHNDPFDDIQ